MLQTGLLQSQQTRQVKLLLLKAKILSRIRAILEVSEQAMILNK